MSGIAVPEPAETLARIAAGLRLLTGPLPHLAGLAAAVRVELDRRVPTMGVFASGRMVANPAFVARLKPGELQFVLAHELLHLALRTHDRARGSGRLEFNYAHDYVINDILRAELGFASIPAGGLDMPGARHRTAEEIVLEMRRNADLMPSRSQVWEGREVTLRSAIGGGTGGGAAESEAPQPDAGDVLDAARERQMFPHDAGGQAARTRDIARAAAQALALARAAAAMAGRGTAGAGSAEIVQALRGPGRTPWQAALQRWIEQALPGERSFARASRRGAERTDVVLPGRRRESWMLNVVLDTSGSMADALPRALGAIEGFCTSHGIDEIRIVQCDTGVTVDETVSPAELGRYRISGLGGSDLTPALLTLAEDPRVHAAVVITDGDVAYPDAPVPYGVLWVVPGAASGFHPPYGQVIAMDAP